MQQTTKYQFNLIDRSDDFSPEPLNQNTQAVEDKLAALETADANLRGEFAAGDSAVRGMLSAHAADTAQHAFIKLGKVEVPAGQTVKFTITNPERYNFIMSDVQVKSPATTGINITANNSAVGSVNPYSSISPGPHGLHFLLPQGGKRSSGFIFNADGGAVSSKTFITYTGGPVWDTLQSMSYGGCDVDAAVTVYVLLA